MNFNKTLSCQYDRWVQNIPNFEELISKFSEQLSDFNRAEFVLNLFNLYPFKMVHTDNEKSKIRSEQARSLGNTNYKQLLLNVAIENYTESIANAPAESEELSLAYGNRAASLLQIGRPDLACADLTRALECQTKDADHRLKLLTRKEKCLKLMENSSFSLENDKKITDCPALPSRSEYFESTSNKVIINNTVNLGRHLIARDPVRTGEILIVEKPYSSVLRKDAAFSYCSNCFTKCIALVPCPFCRITLFCSKKCFDFAKSHYHGVECPIVDKLMNSEVGEITFLSLRTLLKASQAGRGLTELRSKLCDLRSEDNKYKSSDFVRIYELVGNAEKRPADNLFYRTFLSVVIANCLLDSTDFFSYSTGCIPFVAGLLLTLEQSLPCNAHEITDFCNDELREIGAGAFATLSLVNHSCDPNVVRQSCGDLVVLRAIRTIRRNDEILDNYGYHYATHRLTERQSSLSRQYLFQCCCEPCQKNWPMYDSLPDGRPTFKAIVNEKEFDLLSETFKVKLDQTFKNEVSPQTLDFLCDYLDFLDGLIVRPWKMYNACQEAIKHVLNFYPNYIRNQASLS